MASLAKAVRVAATGDVGVGPARILNVRAVSDGVGAGRVTITDGNGGNTIIDFDVVQNSDCDFSIPWEGIRAESTIWVSTLTNITSITIVYG